MKHIEIDEDVKEITFHDGNIRRTIGYEDYSGDVTEENVEDVIEELTS